MKKFGTGKTPRTPQLPSGVQRRPAEVGSLDGLLEELGVRLPAGEVEYTFVSTWAGKHVVQVDVDGEPFAFIRYLLGPANMFPDRWRHFRLGELVHEARVGPRVLGMTPESSALGGRAAIVEAALRPITREELTARSGEAIALLARLHSSAAIHEALSADETEADLLGLSPLARLFSETRERWFDAVVQRWLELGLSEIGDLTAVVGDLMNRLQEQPPPSERMGLVVPCHNDPNHGNFMVNRQGALRMIDFEGLALNNPVADLGVFLDWYVAPEDHVRLLEEYPLAEPKAILERMRIWVPLRYLGIAAHWAARMTRAQDQEALAYGAASLGEWLNSAAHLVYEGDPPADISEPLQRVLERLENLTIEDLTSREARVEQGDRDEDDKKLA